MRKLAAFVALATVLVSCKYMGGSKEAEEDWPVTFYGVGDAPSEPPDSCKFLERIEVKRIENKEPPLDKIEEQARDKVANAVSHIRRTGFTDGYLGKEYKFTASLYWCKIGRPPGAGSASAPAPSASAP